jgi:hypothetical protein
MGVILKTIKECDYNNYNEFEDCYVNYLTKKNIKIKYKTKESMEEICSTLFFYGISFIKGLNKTIVTMQGW